MVSITTVCVQKVLQSVLSNSSTAPQYQQNVEWHGGMSQILL
jgi:hypothetical protein